MSVRFLEDLNVDGNVGVGTSSPEDALHVIQGSGTFRGITVEGVNPGLYLKDTEATSAFHIANNGNSLYFLKDSDGNGTYNSILGYWHSSDNFIFNVGDVGIGTTSPNAKLSVKSDATNNWVFRVTASDGGDLGGIYEDGGTNAELYVKDSTGASSVVINSSGNSYLNGGNVGIGTNNPSQLLELSNNNAKIKLSNPSNPTAYNATIEQNYNFAGPSFAINSVSGNTTRQILGRYLHNLAIMSNGGNVGIGTTSPAKKLDVNGDTNITGYLDLKTSSPTGSPLLRFYQSTTRRGFIQMADTNDNLRVASEYGSVSLEAASTSGVDSDTSYIRIKPGGTVEIGAVDGDATISTDGSMTFKIDADNDETSQKFSFVNNAGTEVASIDENGNLTLTGGINLSLPTSPGTTGTLWNDGGIVRVS